MLDAPSVRVYRNAMPQVTRHLPMLTDVIARRGSTIFNSLDDDHNDERRLQARVPATDAAYKAVHRALGALGVLGDDGRELGDMVVLHSVAGCRQQPWHTDYAPRKLAADPVKPMGVIVALEDGTQFLGHGSQYPDGKHRTYALEPGDVLCFDGDYVHAGAPYRHANTRVHAYITTPRHRSPADETFVVEDETVYDAMH